MAELLPLVFVFAVGLCLSLVLLWFWSSLRGLFAHGQGVGTARAAANAGRAALLREKEELLAAIRELRFEHDLGKVSEADFERLDQRYRTRAREVLRELDEQLAVHRPRARALLESALAGAAIAGATPSGASSSAPDCACGKCGARNDTDALFCKKCGTGLREGAPA